MEHISFAYYKLPDKQHYRYIESNTPPLHIPQLSSLTNSDSGFLIAPFDEKQYPILLITPQTERNVPLHTISPFDVTLPIVTESNKEYLQQFYQCKQLLEGGVVQKIVLSHLFTEDVQPPQAYAELFTKAASTFPKCYVALWYTPETGVWLTITPEVLLEKSDENQWHTMALAGTMPKGNTEWSAKNKQEQQHVVDYIKNVLTSCTNQLTSTALKTVEAAQLLHLRTDFYFSLSTPIGNVLEKLHPTPAVCGLPKETALNALLEIEQHSRKYYAGFSGPLNSPYDSTHLYVTLRCAHWNHQHQGIYYYAGGGLLTDSQAEEEWQEIYTKKQTAECIVKKYISTI